MVQHMHVVHHMIYHIHRLKNKIHTLISIYEDKAFDKISTYFYDGDLKQSGNRRSIPQHIAQAIYDKSTASIILNGEKLKTFQLRSGTT